MLVCRHWHDIMLSTPGIHSQLRIYRRTRKKDVERFGRRWLLDVTVDTGDWNDGTGLNLVEFYACFMAAAEAASRWRSLALISLPPPGICKYLQIMQPLQHLESFKLAASCNFGDFLEPFITTITTNVTPRLTEMEIFHPDASLYLMQPAHSQIFISLTALRLTCKRMQDPVDILPYLHRLEIFETHHLFLPNYSRSVDLPLTHVLRVLRLKSVSVQWMAGRTFPALEECSIMFPRHADAIQSVYMPSCSILKYHSNNLGTLEHFHHPPLAKLEVKCSQWNPWRGNRQLTALHPIFAAQSLTCLHLEIKCSERLLAYMLGLVPALEELWMGLSNPNALSSAFFMAFAAGRRNASGGSSNQTIAPLCRQLRLLHLQYKRWSRGAETNALIPTFGAIVSSHPPEKQSFSFRLSFGEGTKLQEWIIHEPVEIFDVEMSRDRTFIGVSSPHGIVPLSRTSVNNGDYPLTRCEYLLLPLGSEYITTHQSLALPIDDSIGVHSLKEVRVHILDLEIGLNAQLPPNAPLFRTLKVISVYSAPSSFLSGQTFHNLERYKEERSDCRDNLRQDSLTEMPVCTRLVAPLSRLATLKLPRISELVVLIDHEEFDYLWEKNIAVNANLSGLMLLALCVGNHKWSHFIDITKILRSLPALKTLVLTGNRVVVPFVTCIEDFVPMNTQGASELNQSSWEGQISGVLCPKLESLQIEGIMLTERPELIPILKDIVTMRAIIGSPLKSFTFYFPERPELKWELIGRDSSFIMEEVVPAQEFHLDI